MFGHSTVLFLLRRDGCFKTISPEIFWILTAHISIESSTSRGFTLRWKIKHVHGKLTIEINDFPRQNPQFTWVSQLAMFDETRGSWCYHTNLKQMSEGYLWVWLSANWRSLFSPVGGYTTRLCVITKQLWKVVYFVWKWPMKNRWEEDIMSVPF